MFFSNGRKSIGLLSAVVTAIVMVSILAIALVSQDESQRSYYFWIRLAWVELMVLICSIFTNSYLLEVIFGNEVREKGGAMPGFGVAIYFYALFSSSLVIITSFLPENNYLSRFHIILQILLFAAFSLTYALINFSIAGALSGSRSSSEVTSPQQLAMKIGMIEKKIKGDLILNADVGLVKEVKNLKEIVMYSIPSAGPYLDSVEYQSFVYDVENFCRDAIVMIIKDNDELIKLKNKVMELVITAGSLKSIR
jgi:hypothetical protein